MATSCPDQSLVQRVRYWSYLQEQLGLFVCHDPDSQAVKNGSYCFAALALLIALLDCWFIKKALEKEKKIVTPQGMPFNETYCVMSLLLLKVAKYALGFQALMMAVQIVLFVAPPEVYNHLNYGTQGALYSLCEAETPTVFRIVFVVLTSICSTALDLLVCLQALEWQVMLDLLLFQKDRTPDEIVEDFNRHGSSSEVLEVRDSIGFSSQGSMSEEEEHVQDFSKSSSNRDEKSFRKKELRRRRMFQFIVSVLILFLLIVYPLGINHSNRLLNFCLMLERCLILIWCTWVFLHLYYSMQKMHKFEFSRNKSQMLSVAALIILSQGSRLIYQYNQIIDTTFKIIQVCEDCSIEAYALYIMGGYTRLLSQLVVIFIFVYYTPIILIVASLLFLKSSQDILQGISKLDYLLKVSVFQVYKDKQISQPRPETLGHASTFRRVSTVGLILDSEGNKVDSIGQSTD